jgi:hypothetical protein
LPFIFAMSSQEMLAEYAALMPRGIDLTGRLLWTITAALGRIRVGGGRGAQRETAGTLSSGD